MAESDRPLFRPFRFVWGGIRRVIPWPTPREDPEALAAETLRVQIRVIREALGDDIVGVDEHGQPTEDDSEVEYLIHPGRALVRDGDDYEALRSFIEDRDDERFQAGLERMDSPTNGVVVVGLPTRSDGAHPVLATLDEVDAELREGLATPDHVMYVTARAYMCPATEPEETATTQPWPPRNAESGVGSGVRVSVVDSGWWPPAGTSKATRWLDGVDGDPENINLQDMHEYAGHGTFVSGVLRCMAPGTEIYVEGLLPNGGAVLESDITRELEQALTHPDRPKPQLISISAGTHTRKAFDMISFDRLSENHGFHRDGDHRIVAAAGNATTDKPFFPAAFEWVVGVGAVEANRNVCDFSNYGSAWVDVYARGRHLVNAFPTGTYKCKEPKHLGQIRKFSGLARWSGTSFSTPIVTGLIAAEMSATGDSARVAWERLVKGATPHNDPRVGPIKVVGPLQ